MEYCIMPPKIIVRQAASELPNCYKNPLVKLPVEAHFHANKIGWALLKKKEPCPTIATISKKLMIITDDAQ